MSRTKSPIVLCLCLLWASFSILLIISTNTTQGQYVYPLDDTYIHINLAKNFSQSGIWGISKEGFSSLSSSLLWSLLLSGLFLFFGPVELIPLILSFLLATLLLIVVSKWLEKHTHSPIINFMGLLAILFLTPMLPLVFSGLEHILHSLLTVTIVVSASQALSKNAHSSKWKWFLLASLAVLARYESIFMISVLSFFFLLRKKRFHSLMITLGGAIPITLFGFISLRKGWFFFPNSVLLKGRIPSFNSFKDFSDWLILPWKITNENFHVFLVLVLAVILLFLLWLNKKEFWSLPLIMNSILVLMLILHIQFAKIGWFYRYEAYLMILGIVTLAISIPDIFPKNHKRIPLRAANQGNRSRFLEIGMIIFIVIAALIPRATTALLNIPKACKNIYEQQYQMGLFLQRYYRHKNIAANDIGAIHYLSNAQILDLWGLSSMEVALEKRKDSFNTRVIDQITKIHQIKIAILYEHWFKTYGGLPSEWIKVGEWTIRENVICGGDTVSFYAVDPIEKESLINNLKEFSKELPKDVFQVIDGQILQ